MAHGGLLLIASGGWFPYPSHVFCFRERITKEENEGDGADERYGKITLKNLFDAYLGDWIGTTCCRILAVEEMIPKGS